MIKKKAVFLSTVALCLAAASSAFAFTPPNPGDFFYEGFDFASKLSSGAPGATFGLAAAGWAGFHLFKAQVMPAAGVALGAIIIANATKMVTAMGYLF